ncbi:hypothetical protein K431DRAFT_64606 [Polychaeton citri CBS 116435]|uniref:Uncharacterized protein n=1 Tax=Polychaeton citri CBS 116435 TaxID=1314669 RepID=A0A9P4QBW5_9PEZI|nr:hypothetical protein K431DRAFT_64606 [Polychaeton citri CBS 116435]
MTELLEVVSYALPLANARRGDVRPAPRVHLIDQGAHLSSRVQSIRSRAISNLHAMKRISCQRRSSVMRFPDDQIATPRHCTSNGACHQAPQTYYLRTMRTPFMQFKYQEVLEIFSNRQLLLPSFDAPWHDTFYLSRTIMHDTHPSIKGIETLALHGASAIYRICRAFATAATVFGACNETLKPNRQVSESSQRDRHGDLRSVTDDKADVTPISRNTLDVQYLTAQALEGYKSYSTYCRCWTIRHMCVSGNVQ